MGAEIRRQATPPLALHDVIPRETRCYISRFTWYNNVMYLPPETIVASLGALGDALKRRDAFHEIVLLGGASLLVRQLTARATADVDVVGIRMPDGTVRSAYPMPATLLAAAREVALGLGLPPNWLDDRPGSDFVNAAPTGYEQRLERATYGSLVVWHLSRTDIVAIKIVAACERWGERPNKHLEDVRTLAPTRDDFAFSREFAWRIWADASAAWNAMDIIEMEHV